MQINMQSTGRSLAKNTIWNSIDKFSGIGIQMLCTFCMARFLTPSDYGLIGMLSIFIEISNTLIQSGLGSALIREKFLSREDYSTVFWFNLVVSSVLYAVLYVAAPFIADFYQQEQLTAICRVSFLVLPISALSIVQNTKFQRDLNFKKLSLISLSTSILASFIAICAAFYFRNVWAIVLQMLVSNILRSSFLWLASDMRPNFSFSMGVFVKYFKFSKNILLSSIIGAIFNNINNLLIGRFYTPADLGYYAQADKMKGVTSYNTSQVIQSVTYPLLSKVNNDGIDLKIMYKKIILTTLLFVSIIVVLFMTIACDAFEVLMGSSQWRTSGIYFMILGLNSLLIPLHSINQNILLVKGNSRTLLWLEICRRIIMIIILLVVVNFSVYFFAAGLSIYSFLLLFLNLHFCGKPINYTLSEQLRDITPILCKQVIVFIIGLCLNFLFSGINVYIRMIVVLSIGIIIEFVLFRKNKYLLMTVSLLPKNKVTNLLKRCLSVTNRMGKYN